MRIIAGEFRGRKILPPASEATRPITDRAKQSVFDVLMPYLEDAVVYDLFAGTGSLGLEALSRGCRRATFFESDRSAIGLLEKNIAALGVGNRVKVVRGDLFGAKFDGEKADLVFLDPPYRFVTVKQRELVRLVGRIPISTGGLVVFRHEGRDELAFENLRAVDVRDYGSMRVEFLGRLT